MRFLHTSDWHLGRTLHGVDLTAHQAAFCDHLVQVVAEQRVDAVLIAGDVYDRAIPPVEAVDLLSTTLRRLAELTTVVLTPGNHDSAVRLGFGADLLTGRVRILADQRRVDRPVLFTGPDGERVAVYGLPYLDPDVARHTLAPDGAVLARSHAAVLGAAMDRVRADLAERDGVRSVVLAHAFVVGGEASESERDIRVGGVDHAPAAVFDGIDYVALGHLHGPQRVAEHIRYSGSPLAYSFSEARHAKSTALIELDATGPARVTLIPAPVPRRMTDLTGRLDDVLSSPGHDDDWVRVTVTDPLRPEDLYRRVKTRFPHALVIQHQPPATASAGRSAEVGPGRDPLEVVADFIAHVGGAAPTEAEADVLRQAYEQVMAAERSA
ncbi:exonuclease SbcCD subunit D [Cellulomonas sp. RIT-PI-Y]|uniref:exonuclease SbcCD subunit D n=1 Tax=Cellulomonas sp. RIT-PI-Y TaxID=3035297 RepID=UPI0021D80908|nr:exonuclease SbcCD subunit D [Cellulomonas sp. RIT-PI-Y]